MRIIAFTEREVDFLQDLIEEKLEEIKAIPTLQKSNLQRILNKIEKEYLLV